MATVAGAGGLVEPVLHRFPVYPKYKTRNERLFAQREIQTLKAALHLSHHPALKAMSAIFANLWRPLSSPSTSSTFSPSSILGSVRFRGQVRCSTMVSSQLTYFGRRVFTASPETSEISEIAQRSRTCADRRLNQRHHACLWRFWLESA